MTMFLYTTLCRSPKAQGCEARATLGLVAKNFPQPQRGCGTIPRDAHNLVEVETPLPRFPKVARASQPWAGGHCPVGANECPAFPADESRTLAALRDALRPKLLSGECPPPSFWRATHDHVSLHHALPISQSPGL